MSTGAQLTDGRHRRERFGSGWTGVVAVALFVYTVAAILVTFVDAAGSRFLEVLHLYSDAPPSIIATLLAGAAAKGGNGSVYPGVCAVSMSLSGRALFGHRMWLSTGAGRSQPPDRQNH